MHATIPNIVLQHVEDTGLLWLRRDQAIRYPDFTVEMLAKLDLQLEANRDGMRIAGDAAWKIAEHELRWEAPGEVFAAAVFALESGDSQRIDRVLKLATRSWTLSRPFISALGWLEWDQVRGPIEKLIRSQDATSQRIGIAACAIHRQDPGDGLDRALQSDDPALLARSLRAVGELGRRDLLISVKSHFVAIAPAIRFSAAWSTALLTTDEQAIEILKELVEQQFEDSECALQLVARRQDAARNREWLSELTRRPALLRTAIRVAGEMGDPEVIPWLLEQMETPTLARIAGEAAAMITGVDIAYQKLNSAWPEGFIAGPTEDPADNRVAMDEDEHSPWPDRAKLTVWWDIQQARFAAGQRYLSGELITTSSLKQILRQGRQPHRTAAAVELMCLASEGCLFETRAPGFKQQKLLT